MSERCDNKSVGVLLTDSDDRLMLISRRKAPYGWAPVAGHIDDHGSPEQAAVNEVREELGLMLAVDSLCLVIEGRQIHNQCRRIGGDHHTWWVYQAPLPAGMPQPSGTETNGAAPMDSDQLQQLANFTSNALSIDREDGPYALEPVWRDLLIELQYIDE